jgi:peptidoglycan/xylan/chitin deacetylase (PgdA/CDA1 family)
MPEARWHTPPLMRASIALHLCALITVFTAPALWPWMLGAVAANHLLIAAVGLWPRSCWLGPNWTRLPATSRARNEIALTIDDGPDPEVTPAVLDLLDRHAVRATFFCIGNQAARYPDLCREIVRRGHALENHSQRHRHHFSLMGPHALLSELQAAQDTLGALSGQRPLFFRAPAGLRNPFLEPVLARLGLRLASWSVRGFDTRVGDAARVRRRLAAGLKAGAILLLHDGHAARTPAGIPVILDVLPALLESAAAAGLRPVTLREALA